MSEKLKWADDLVFRDDDLICFNKNNGCVFSFNKTGYAVFLCFETATTEQQVAKFLASHWAIEISDATKDTRQLVAQLIENRFLITIGEDTT